MLSGKNEETPLIDRLLPYLLTNYPFTAGNGLVHGKMGGVLFFALYSKYSGNEIYIDYAGMLMEDIYESLNKEMPVSFETGLCGIGWCIEYMVKNSIMEGNTDEALEDIDHKIMEWDPARMSDRSFKTGLGGILFYVVTRLQSFDRGSGPYPFDGEYLTKLLAAVNSIKFSEEDNVPSNLIKEFNDIMSGKIDFDKLPVLPQFLFEGLPEDMRTISDHPLGISKGLTGVALKEIMR